MTAAPTAGTSTLVGLRRQAEVLAAALDSGRHVVLEGPPGTGKSTLLREVAAGEGRSVVFVEGNAELTPARLVGQYDPALVLADGYRPEAWLDGPLLSALREGALLYLEELNRIPEETLNVLVTVLAEGEIHVPRLGRVAAAEGFRLIAAMNPFDAVGTARVSQAIADRMCRVVLGYPDERAERRIVEQATGVGGPLARLGVGLVRASREHAHLRAGSSVRGAIDFVHLAGGLGRVRGEPAGLPARDTALDAAWAALSGRVRVQDGVDRRPEDVIEEILDRLLAAVPDSEDDVSPEHPEPDEPEPPGKADGPSPLPRRGRGGPGSGRPGTRADDRRFGARQDRSTLPRQVLLARHEGMADVSPGVGQLDESALAARFADDPDEAARLLADLAIATDPTLRARARAVAARLLVAIAAEHHRPVRGVRRLVPVAGGREGDLDLERTLDRLTPGRPPGHDDVVTREWRGRQRAVCLLVDISGSMRGHGVAVAAVAAAGVVLAARDRGRVAVLGFAGTVETLQEYGRPRDPHDLVGELVALRGRGSTDVTAALRAAARALDDAPPETRTTLLLSDCVATAGGDPLAAVEGVGRLHVLCTDPDRAESAAAAARLADRTGGRWRPVRRLHDVAPAVAALVG